MFEDNERNQNRDSDQGDSNESGGRTRTQDMDQDTQKRGSSKENNPGNFANDPERASEAGRKGGRS